MKRLNKLLCCNSSSRRSSDDDGEVISHCNECISNFIVKYPFSFFASQIFLHLIICAVLISDGDLVSETDDKDWLVPGSSIVEIFDAFEQAKKDVDPINTGSNVLRAWSDEESVTRITYTNMDPNSDTIFTPHNLQSMCEFELVLVNHTGYQDVCLLSSSTTTSSGGANESSCAPQSMSVVNLFYDSSFSMIQNQSCPLLTQSRVDQVVSMMFNIATNTSYPVDDSTRLFYSFFLSKDSDSSTFSNSKTKSILVLGAPLTEEDENEEELSGYALDKPYQVFLESVGESWVKMFDLKNSFLKTKYRNDALIEDRMEVKWINDAVLSKEFEYMVNTDMSMAAASVVFVLCWMWFHMGSFALSMLGMYQIVMSIPVALFIYRYVFQIQYFQSLHQMTIFLVLGIGADDVFVFSDGWQIYKKQKNLKSRMKHTYDRTFKAVFHTSFTTVSAFTAMGVSPIIPMRTFGIFAAIAILVNFIFVITLTPAAIVLWEKGYCCGKKRGCCGCLWRKKSDDDVVLPASSSSSSSSKGLELTEVKGEDEEDRETKKQELKKDEENDDENEHHEMEEDEFLNKYYLSWLLYKRQGVPVCAWSIVLVLLGVAGFLISSAAQLETPREVERWFPDDHMMEAIQEELREDFIGSSLDAYVDISYIYGIQGIDRSGFDHFGSNSYRGSPVYDTSLNIYDSDAQQSILEACDEMMTWSCTVSGCDTPFDTLALPGTRKCFMQEFKIWHFERYGTNETFSPTIPNSTEFMNRLKLFRCNAPAQPSNSTCDDAELNGEQIDWSERIGIVDGSLRFVSIDFTSSLQWDTAYATRQDVMQRGKDLRIWIQNNDDVNAASSNLGDVKETGGHFWAWTITEGELVASLFRGFAICFPIAFTVLLVATQNLVLALFATSTIAMIVGCVLGSVRLFLGWGLGVGEAIAGIIVVGFSVDYVVHLGHMYNESEGTSRESRVRGASYAMAKTVAAGGVTTLGAGLMMLPCQVQFFPKMAILIVSTITFSLLYSLGFFMALCTVMGPEGDFGSLTAIWRLMSGGKEEGVEKKNVGGGGGGDGV